MGLIPYWSA